MLNKYSLVSLSLGFMVAAGCGGGSSGGGSGDSVSSGDACSAIGLAKVANGTQCTAGAEPTASPLARLRILSAEGEEGICTGTVIDSSTILTAAHCFADDVAEIEVDTFAGTFTAVSFANSPSFDVVPSPFFEDAEIFLNDISIVNVAGSISTAKARILTSRQPAIGEEAVVAGFGEFRQGELDGSLRAGIARVVNVTSQHIFISFEGNQSHPCQGDSGGPILVDVNGELAIAGVVSQSDPQVDPRTICRPGDVTLYTNVQSQESLNFLGNSAPGVGAL